MRLQLPKCEALCISNKRHPPTFTYLCDGQPLQWGSVVRYLGVYINQYLTWSDHCKSVCYRTSRVFTLLRHLLYCCSSSAKIWSYCALILPIIQYGRPVCLPYYSKDLKILQSVLPTGYVAVVSILVPIHGHDHLDFVFLVSEGPLSMYGSTLYHCYFL